MIAEDRIDAALDWLKSHGVSDEQHHMEYAFDLVVRILTGCPEVTAVAVDANGTTYSYTTLGESQEYKDFVREYQDGDDGPESYTWRTGIAP